MNTITEVWPQIMAKSDDSWLPAGNQPVGAPVAPAPSPEMNPEAGRRLFFRGVRLLLAGAFLYGGFLLVRENFANPHSDLAYFNAEITTVRAPIGGELRLAAIRPGTPIAKGDMLFEIENSRIGNQESLAQVNGLEELVARLHADCAEAEVNASRYKEICTHYQSMYDRKIIAKVVLLEHEQRVVLAATTLTQKKAQLELAESRRTEMLRLAGLQKNAAVCMPCDGVVWSIHEKNGAQVGEHGDVIDIVNPQHIWVDAFLAEGQAANFGVNTAVIVRTMDGKGQWKGRVDSVRAGVGRIAYENFIVAAPPGDFSKRRIAVRVELVSPNPFAASEFFGIGRSMVVSLNRS